MTDNAAQPEGAPAEYQRTGVPGPGSPEYEAMDKLAKMFERQVDELRGQDSSPENGSAKHHDH